MMSVPPPAACELMNLIGRSGQLCAWRLACGQHQHRQQQPSNNADHIILPTIVRRLRAARFCSELMAGMPADR